MNATELEMMTAFHRHELMLDTRAEDQRWERWTKDVETRLGHDLDGDQETEGYSIDHAFAFYTDGLTGEEAAREFETLEANV